MPNGQPTVAIGVRLPDHPPVWGVCLSTSAAELVAIKRTIENVVTPTFAGHAVTSFRELMQIAEGLTETVLVQTTIHPDPAAQNGKLSRRRLISGLTMEDKPPEPVTTVETIERPLSPTLLYGLSQAFLQATAIAQNNSMAAVLHHEYGYSTETKTFGLYTAVDEPATSALITELNGLWYNTSKHDPAKQLGDDNRRLQQYVRQLQQWFVQANKVSATICLDLQGNLGTLYENNIGKILGALVGLENAAKPYTLHLVDPLLGEDRPSQIKLLHELKDTLRFRRLQIQLWGRAQVQDTADVEAFIEAEAVHGLQIDLSLWGSLHQALLALKQGQTAGLPMALLTHPHETAASQHLLNQIASVTRPDIFLVKAQLAEAYNNLMQLQL